jgi:hypothetical protein
MSVVFHPPLGPTNAVFFHQSKCSEKLLKTFDVDEYPKDIFLSSMLSDFATNVFAFGFSL